MSNRRLHDDEVSVDVGLVRGLLDTQFPQWSELQVWPVPSTGTDNVTYRLGDDLAVRLPRIRGAVAQVDKELDWLPRLAPLLPVDVPRVVARGWPSNGYPWPWLVSSWLGGVCALDALDASDAPGDDDLALAADLGRFVAALHRLDLPRPPAAGYRAGALAPRTTRFVPPSTSFVTRSSTPARCRCGRPPWPRRHGVGHPWGFTATCSPAT